LQPSSHSCLLPQLLMLLNVAKQSLYRGQQGTLVWQLHIKIFRIW
jgi:hypothetical protein